MTYFGLQILVIFCLSWCNTQHPEKVVCIGQGEARLHVFCCIFWPYILLIVVEMFKGLKMAEHKDKMHF